jgi:murein DD-endopeptidase MepM/ murein hydrolase activator NlpD
MPAYPDSAARPGRGWWWSVLALLLSVGAFVPAAAPAAAPVAAPAAVVERSVPPPTTAPDPPRVPGLWMPVKGAVVRGFDARAGPYGAGHRGIDIAAPMGELVLAPAAGRVVFAGPVAGTTWVSVQIAPGVLVTLGPVPDPAVRAGPVRARSPIGRVGPGHGGTLHLGVRVDGVYVDPLPYLLDRPRARLAPLLSPGGLPPPERADRS